MNIFHLSAVKFDDLLSATILFQATPCATNFFYILINCHEDFVRTKIIYFTKLHFIRIIRYGNNYKKYLRICDSLSWFEFDANEAVKILDVNGKIFEPYISMNSFIQHIAVYYKQKKRYTQL